MTNAKSILVISDMHIPYHHKDLLPFLKALKSQYEPDRVVCIGDEIDCFPGAAEILTEHGWVTFKNLLELDPPVKVAQWREDSSVEFVTPEAYVNKPYTGELLRIEHESYLSMTTPKHTIVKRHPITGKIHRREAWDTEGTNSWEIPRYGTYSEGTGSGLLPEELQLQVAFQADGTFDKGGVKFGFAKDRKVERLLSIINKLGLKHSSLVNTRGDKVIRIFAEDTPAYLSKTFDMTWLTKLNLRERLIVIEELKYWDGTIVKTRQAEVGFRYSCTIKHNLDFVQALAATSGVYSSKLGAYYVSLYPVKVDRTSQKSAKVSRVAHEGNVYCVQVPSGMILVRQEGHVVVSGNCHALSFHDSDPDLLSAGDELLTAISWLQKVYKLFPAVDVVESNHGSMIYRKGKHHGLPRKYIKDYGDVLEAPPSWIWHDEISINTKLGEVLFRHQFKKDPLICAQQMAMNVVQGHFHESFDIQYVSSPNKLLWAMTVGCLIDKKSLAFTYNKTNTKRPIIGVGVIINGLPQLIPMVLDKKGRWIGKLL